MKTTYIKPNIKTLVITSADLLDTIQQSTGSGGTIDNGQPLDAPRHFTPVDTDNDASTTSIHLWD